MSVAAKTQFDTLTDFQHHFPMRIVYTIFFRNFITKIMLKYDFQTDVQSNGLDQSFSTQTASRPIFFITKFPRPAIENLEKEVPILRPISLYSAIKLEKS